MKIGVLTSSRADFGIYLPLLEKLEEDPFFDLEIIAFGTHLSRLHGYTHLEIQKSGFKKVHTVSSLISNDSENAIATSFALTALKFADFWETHLFDWILCLGDRFEMAAAVQAGIPFGVNFAHIHGGETTLGAIDNVYRHQISLASRLHFPATEAFGLRIQQIIGTSENIFPVGSISIDEIQTMDIPSEDEFRKSFEIVAPFALLTFHPETVATEKNQAYAREMRLALQEVSKTLHLVITMPNADTFGSIFRHELNRLKMDSPNQVTIIENFGKLNYFAAMRYCKILIGNTSSGIIEAATFGKYVVNVGDRQQGRMQSENIVNCSFKADDILDSVTTALHRSPYTGENVYFMGGTVKKIINILKELHESA